MSTPKDETVLPFKEQIIKDFRCLFVFPPIMMHHQLSSMDEYSIKTKYEKLMKSGLKKFTDMCQEDYIHLNRIQAILDKGVTIENYKMFFKYHLWLEEAAAVTGLTRYNMFNVKLKLISSSLIELEVPGLAENRPSVRPGDIITIRATGHSIGYQGIVHSVLDKSIIINKFVREFFLLLTQARLISWDVKFELTRTQIIRSHQGVINVANGKLNRVFPVRSASIVTNKVSISSTDLINENINEEQLKAVQSIVNCTSHQAPYILFGPPGTGKTITIVEAILQTLKIHPEKKILVCAPSNAACDNVAIKLLEHCKTGMLRLYTTTRELILIPSSLKICSNVNGKVCFRVKEEKLSTFKIVICTLSLSGRFKGIYRPDVLFIDEAAQASEPECDIAISHMLPGSFIVLAGDPQQLGPVCLSVMAEKKGLGQSLMERLMFKNELYKEDRLQYDEDYITMLVRNYRSHSDILEIPNKHFYKNKLIVSVLNDDGISNISVSKKVNNFVDLKPGRAVEFCGLPSKEERNGSSPSYYNKMEIDMVIKYVKVLLELQEYDVKEADIGIITPYIRQVSKIKEALVSLKLKDINVGTTEAYQGSEKRIIIISTVRAQDLLLEYDTKYRLGFVSNKRRFNVALTRAKSKLIIIGNPHVLGTDKHWLSYINFCKDLKSYFGMDYGGDQSIHTICESMSKVNFNDENKENIYPVRQLKKIGII